MGRQGYDDLAGQIFGRLTAIELHHARKFVHYWLCRCECGNAHIANEYSLKSGNTKSCGCLAKICHRAPAILKQNTEYRLVAAGRFKVNDHGDVVIVIDGKDYSTSVNYIVRNKKYATVSYSENSKQIHFYLHRLVAEAFIPNPNNYPQINHKDGDSRNNLVSNLEWCTAKQNMQHAHKTGLINPMRNARPCKACGELTLSKKGTCMACRNIQICKDNQLNLVSKRAESVCEIDTDDLYGLRKIAVEMRAQGKTL